MTCPSGGVTQALPTMPENMLVETTWNPLTVNGTNPPGVDPSTYPAADALRNWATVGVGAVVGPS